MNTPDLVMICITAFISVFVLLGVLATVMRLIIVVFPDKEKGADQALISAIATSYQIIYPGTHITRIEEVK